MISVQRIDAPGIRIVDEIETVQCELWTDEPVEPERIAPEETGICYEINHAVRIETMELTVPRFATIHVRDPDGTYQGAYNPGEESLAVEPGQQIDIPSAVKLYVVADSAGTISADDDAVRLTFEERATLDLGIRSFHSKPAETITCPREPEALMKALSAFSSSLKMTSCERSYPSHRGHPPTLEFGDELSIPDEINPPETGVIIEIPPEIEYILPVAPLAYYLGAELVPGSDPVLKYEVGSYPLDGPDGFEETVIETLRTVHFLDCIVRTEGLFQLDLGVEEEFYDLVGDSFVPEKLYDAPLTHQLDAYLDLAQSTDEFEELLPEWSVCVDVKPEMENVRALPYLLDELALIRTKTHELEAEPDPETEEMIDGFLRAEDETTDLKGIFYLEDAPAMTQAYLGQGEIAVRADNLSVEVLERRVNRSKRSDHRISVAVVCNEPTMADESVVEEYYGIRDLIQFDVEGFHELTCEELRELFETDYDLVHYIGHVDDEGIRCTDGVLDVNSVPEVGADAVLLNGCDSYEQGQALVDAGVLASVVTVTPISNALATQVGREVARAFNCGFTLRGALDVVKKHVSMVQYSVVGDGRIQLVQSDDKFSYYFEIKPDPGAKGGPTTDLLVDVFAYPTPKHGPGSITHPYLGDSTHHLPFGHINQTVVNVDEFISFCEGTISPYSLDGTLYWGDEITRDDLIKTLQETESSSTRSRSDITTRRGRSGLAQQ